MIPARDAEVADPTSPGATILDLYQAIWDSSRQAAVRYRVAITVELGMVALWFVLRTVVDVEGGPYLTWTALACAVALISPTSGLVILVATAPFFEPVSLSRALGMRHVLVAALGISVALRLISGGWRSMTWTAPVRLAILLGAVVALGVANTWRLFPGDWATHATQMWLASIGGAMVLLVVGAWVAGTGARRFVVVAVISSSIAIVLSLVELGVPHSISASPFEWVGFWKDFSPRLSGAIASPNGVAALAVMPACVLTACAVLGSGRAYRLLAAAGATVLLVAMYVTYSRAALISLFGLAVVVSWRLHRALGMAVLVVGMVAGLLLLPAYLQLRGQVGAAGPAEPGSLLVANDRERIAAWQAAAAMWADEPVTGHGFLSYKPLGERYGDHVLNSPHNEWLRLFAEEGIVAGIVGLALIATTLSWLAHAKGAVSAGILGGAAGYFTMATFNNPFLFIQVSAVVFPLVGYALVTAARGPDRNPPDADEAASEQGPESRQGA